MENTVKINEQPVMVTVCCATYNHEKYIESALKGFVNQITNFKFEVIVHEDASTDGTRAIIEKYVAMYPDIFVPIYQDENQYSKGRGVVLRNMISKAKGKYIATCEGDDYWTDSYKLQKQFDVLEEHKECSVCVHRLNPIIIDENGEHEKKPQIKNYRFKQGIIPDEVMYRDIWLGGGYPFQTCTFFAKREIYDVIVKNKEPFFKYMLGDTARYRLCLMYGKFYFINEFMACRRIGVEGSWHDRWDKFSNDEKEKYYHNLLNGEKLFDEFSNYRFHDYISIHIFNILSEICIYQTEGIREELRKCKLGLKMIIKEKLFMVYIRYIIMKISPNLYKTLYEIKMNNKSV